MQGPGSLTPPHAPHPCAGPSEYVRGLSYEEAATLLNVDVADEAIMSDIFDTGGCQATWVLAALQARAAVHEASACIW